MVNVEIYEFCIIFWLMLRFMNYDFASPYQIMPKFFDYHV